MGQHSAITSPLPTLKRTLARIENPSARKSVIMSKWERKELTSSQAMHLIRALDLDAA